MLDLQQGFPDSQGKRSVHLGPATDSKPDKSSVTPVNSFQVLYLNRSADIYIHTHTLRLYQHIYPSVLSALRNWRVIGQGFADHLGTALPSLLGSKLDTPNESFQTCNAICSVYL
jgi:hypothetical protein